MEPVPPAECPAKQVYGDHLYIRTYGHPIRRLFRRVSYLRCLDCDLKVEEPPMPKCPCDPRHIDIGGYDRGCPVHDRKRRNA